MIPERLPSALPVKRPAPLLLAAAALWVTACGMPGSPQPPSLHLPERVTDLAASRTGDTVRLTWTMPRRTTDRVVLTGNLDVHICRKLESEACDAVADIKLEADKPAAYDDRLSSALASGAPRPLAYLVEIRNHAGRSAGPSNAAYSAAGAAPSPLEGLDAATRADGILLHWRPGPAGSSVSFVRLQRVLKSANPVAPKPRRDGFNTVQSAPTEQVLEADPTSGTEPLQTLDRDAPFDQTYVYTAQRVVSLTLAGHTLEVKGAPSDPITVDARDVFPPRSPTGLAAIADSAEGAIDLSWSANTESDFAGYIVYRQEAGSATEPARLSPAAPPLLVPAFRDTSALPGHAYLYQVTAIDRDGNQSPRSAPAQESLPQAR